MPTRKIDDVKLDYCRDSEHYPPMHMSYQDGVYEHECPGCKRKFRFVVRNPTLLDDIGRLERAITLRCWIPSCYL